MLFRSHFVHHTRIPLSLSTSSPFSFSLLPLSRSSLILSSSFFPLLPLDSRSSPALSFSYLFFFLFLLDSINSLALSVILDSIILLAFLVSLSSKFKHTQTRMERGEIVFAPLHHHRCSSSSLRSACNQGSYRLLFFSS